MEAPIQGAGIRFVVRRQACCLELDQDETVDVIPCPFRVLDLRGLGVSQFAPRPMLAALLVPIDGFVFRRCCSKEGKGDGKKQKVFQCMHVKCPQISFWFLAMAILA